MARPSDREYFAKRESDERAAANAATTRDARAIHLQLAYRYATLQTQLDESPGNIIVASFGSGRLKN